MKIVSVKLASSIKALYVFESLKDILNSSGLDGGVVYTLTTDHPNVLERKWPLSKKKFPKFSTLPKSAGVVDSTSSSHSSSSMLSNVSPILFLEKRYEA